MPIRTLFAPVVAPSDALVLWQPPPQAPSQAQYPLVSQAPQRPSAFSQSQKRPRKKPATTTEKPQPAQPTPRKVAKSRPLVTSDTDSDSETVSSGEEQFLEDHRAGAQQNTIPVRKPKETKKLREKQRKKLQKRELQQKKSIKKSRAIVVSQTTKTSAKKKPIVKMGKRKRK